MASIDKRPSGSYRVQFRVNGRLKGVTFATMTDAQAFTRLVDRLGPVDALAVLDEQSTTAATVPTVSEYLRRHVAALDGVTAGTRLDYERMITRRVDTHPLGATPITVASTTQVRSWLASLEDAGLSAKTRRNHHALVSAAFARAIDEQLRGTNPARGLRIKADTAAAARVFLSESELAVLVGATPARYQPLVVFLAGTGMRWGEATALLVGDVDLEARVPVAYVRRAWKRTGRGMSDTVGPPKTQAGVRTVSLPPQVVTEVRPLVDGHPADAYLFTAPHGGPVRSDHFHARVWGPTLRALNAREDADGNPVTPRLAKRPRIHDLRHSHASSLIAAGVPLTIVQRRLGHEDISTTVSVYGHLAPDHLEVAALAASTYLVQAVPELEA